MASKEDIREKHLYANGLSVNKSPVGKMIQKAAYDAMDEYAKAIAIGFTKWKDKLEIIKEKNTNHYLINYAMAEWSLFAKDEEELYSKYLQTLQP